MSPALADRVFTTEPQGKPGGRVVYLAQLKCACVEGK